MKDTKPVGRSIYWCLITLTTFLFSCDKEQIEVFDEPFVHIMQNDKDFITVNSRRRDVVSYYIYYSTIANDRDLDVSYTIHSGEGLEEGVDYELITTENPLKFPRGIYKRPIQIRWLNNPVVESMDNTLRITLESTNYSDVSIGLPGRYSYQADFTIEKVN